MDRPNISANSAVIQAGKTIGQYLSQAETEIDSRFGKRFAVKHPELLAACVLAQTQDFNSVALCSALYEIRDALDTVTAGVIQVDARVKKS